MAFKYTERLAEARILPSVGSAGAPYDNAVADSVIGLFKTEVIRHLGSQRDIDAVEFTAVEW